MSSALSKIDVISKYILLFSSLIPMLARSASPQISPPPPPPRLAVIGCNAQLLELPTEDMRAPLRHQEIVELETGSAASGRLEAAGGGPDVGRCGKGRVCQRKTNALRLPYAVATAPRYRRALVLRGLVHAQRTRLE